MSAFWAYALVSFGSLFSIVDPFAAVPIFLGLVGDQDRRSQGLTALRASLTCLVILSAFAAAGAYIFSFFGITIPAFKVAGGILLFAVGLEMMRARQSDTRSTTEERSEAASKEDVGLIPLGLPLLSGPGAIATVMVLMKRAAWSVVPTVTVLASVALTCLITWVVLRGAVRAQSLLKKTTLHVLERVMGLLLAAVAIEFMIGGLRDVWPSLR